MLSTIAPRLARAPAASTATGPKVGRGGCSFSDDLVRLSPQRLAVRVRITDRDEGGWLVDLRDSDAAVDGFALSADRALDAVALAFAHALGEPVARHAFELLCDDATWIGSSDAPDPAAIAFGMARVFDATAGALANAWPGRVGAGSCSLGAIVGLGERGEEWTEVIAGGEGGTPTRDGRDAWPSPVVTDTHQSPLPDWLERKVQVRLGSGGQGARSGGCGVIWRATPSRATKAFVAIDRIDNPPHGIERAGPPKGARVRIEAPGGLGRAVRPWHWVEIPAWHSLVIETAGGAGHGFPGYGDIDWDG